MKQAKRILTLLSTSLLLAASGCSTMHNSSPSLQGTWNGQEPGTSPETPRELVISGHQFRYRGAEPNDWCNGTIVVREDTQPKQLLLTLTECGQPGYVGKTARVIYRIENGTLTAAGNEPGNPDAPSNFDAPDARHMTFEKK